MSPRLKDLTRTVMTLTASDPASHTTDALSSRSSLVSGSDKLTESGMDICGSGELEAASLSSPQAVRIARMTITAIGATAIFVAAMRVARKFMCCDSLSQQP